MATTPGDVLTRPDTNMTNMTNTQSPDSFEQLKQNIFRHKKDLQFGHARRLLQQELAQNSSNIWVIQQLALCTYKDEELQPNKRFSDALELLDKIGLRDQRTTIPETLSLGGAVYKRKWEYNGVLEHLHEALLFYTAAWERNPEEDEGYGAVNAAYILDILASRARSLSRRTGTPNSHATKYAKRAKSLRMETLTVLQKKSDEILTTPNNYWLLATLAELHFGLGNYKEAVSLFADAKF